MSSLLVKIFFSPLIMSHGLGINYRLRVEISCSWKDLWFHARNKRGAVDKDCGFIRVLHLVTWLSLSSWLLFPDAGCVLLLYLYHYTIIYELSLSFFWWVVVNKICVGVMGSAYCSSSDNGLNRIQTLFFLCNDLLFVNLSKVNIRYCFDSLIHIAAQCVLKQLLYWNSLYWFPSWVVHESLFKSFTMRKKK